MQIYLYFMPQSLVIRTTVRNNRSSLWRDKNVNSKGPFRVAGRSYNFQNIWNTQEKGDVF